MTWKGSAPRGPRRALLALALAAVLGALVGHLLWSTGVALRLGSASVRPPGYRYAAREGARPGEAGGGPSGSPSAVPGPLTAKVDPGLVDIDTELGLEHAAAAGTGMVLSSTGEVVTNNHVIDAATRITATDVGSGATYRARVVGYDYSHDIAVLQLEGASGLKTVSLGDSGSLRLGERVATIGNAGGAGGTPSAAAGEVSALDQSITASDESNGGEERLGDLVELEGDVEPGDSGGPLVNRAGEVLGMDTAASQTFQFQSASDQAFAIPIDEVAAIAGQIGEGRASSSVHIGATAMLGVFVEGQREEGALVAEVIEGTPAADSGLQARDLITALGGSSISSPTSLTAAMLRQRPGARVRLTWQTPAGARQSATVTLSSGPPQ